MEGPAAGSSQVSLCVAISAGQSSAQRGHAAKWIVTAWTKGGNVPDAVVRLQVSPGASGAHYSFGCGTSDGTASCDLGAIDAKSAQRQLQAQATVPASAKSVTSVTLTVIGSAANLRVDPRASASMTVTAAPKPPKPSDTPTPNTTTTTSPIPVPSLPGVPTPSPTLSPGGNAGGLFPALSPSASAGNGSSGSSVTVRAKTRAVANVSALPQGATVVGAQIVGLGALAVAFVLAVTRLTIRRPGSAAAPAGEEVTPEETPAPDETPGPGEAPTTVIENEARDANEGKGESGESGQSGESGESGESETPDE